MDASEPYFSEEFEPADLEFGTLDPVSRYLADSPRGRRRLARSEMVLLIVEHHRTLLRHLLFWLQDHPYLRARWHRRASEMSLFEDSVLLDLKGMQIELESAQRQYPFGYGPGEEASAQLLKGRLAILACELRGFHELCQAYFRRLEGNGGGPL